MANRNYSTLRKVYGKLPFAEDEKRDKEKRKLYNAEYRLKHGERVKMAKRQWRLENLELSRKRGRESYQRNRKKILAYAKRTQDRSLAARRLRKTGMSADMFEARMREQDFKCAICFTAIDMKAHADHDHAKMIPRGVLCPPCNKGLGLWRDNVDVLRSAIAYLDKWGHP